MRGSGPASFGRRAAAGVALAALLAGGAVALAQSPWDSGMMWRWSRMPPRFATPDSFDGSFNFCRLMYQSVRREAGGMGWWTDYPEADFHFSIRLSELTRARISRQPSGDPEHLVVRLTDDELFRCPFIFTADVGTMGLSEEEIVRLRAYLQKGGFFWVDDFWGTRAWEHWMREIRRVLPAADYPLVELPPDHVIFRALFEVNEVPQIPAIQFWRRSGGRTSERGADSETPTMHGIVDRHGRVMVLMTHNTDIADAWEREGEDPEFFYLFSVDGYALGVNVLMYAMTH